MIRVEGRSWQEGDNEAAASVDAGEVDRSSSPRQWIMLVRAMGWRTSPVVASGLALTAACLLTWQLTTQDWCGRECALGGCRVKMACARAGGPVRGRLYIRLCFVALFCRLDAYAAGREYKALEITSFIFGAQQ